MSDIQCPYCGSDQEIIHDDGQGYEEYAKPSRMKRIRRCVTSSRFTRPLLKAAVGAALLVWLMHLMEIILRIYHTAGEPPV